MEEADDKPQDLCNIAQEMDFEKIKKFQYLHVEQQNSSKEQRN